MWNMVMEDSDIMSALASSYDPQENAMKVEDACNTLAARQVFLAWDTVSTMHSQHVVCVKCRIYACKFSTHSAASSARSLGDMLAALKGPSSKLSEKTRKELPSLERVQTTFRNINWLLQYWMCRPPSFLQDQPCNDKDKQQLLHKRQTQWDYGVCYPDPISPEFGFAMVQTSEKSSVIKWLDDIS